MFRRRCDARPASQSGQPDQGNDPERGRFWNDSEKAGALSGGQPGLGGDDRHQVAKCAAILQVGSQEEIEVVAEVDVAVVGVIAHRPRTGIRACEAVEEHLKIR